MAFFADRTIEPDPLMLNVLEQISSQVIGQAIERQRLEERFRALVQHAPDLIAVLGAEGIIGYISPAVQAIIGYSPEALIGQNILDYVHPDDLAPAQAKLAELCREPIALMTLKVRLRHQDGSWRVLELKGNNWLGLRAVDGLIINGRDVTELEYTYQALREMEDALQQAVTAF
jgi:PAS domain S-box-containing protein